MKLSKLYSNMPKLFEPVDFVQGLNVVMAEIRLPENLDKDTHNLGKTTLGRLLDFCFLTKRKSQFFLFKHSKLFKEFVFFLEIELADASYVTVRRSVEKASKISFKKHAASRQDFTTLSESEWDHLNMPFDQAVAMLDSLLDWRTINPWSYRKGIGYQLRSQVDYQDVFQLSKFKGAYADWKPYLAHILGFNDDLISSYYQKENEIEKEEKTEQTIKREMGGSIDKLSEIEGMLQLKKKDVEQKQELLDAFDFRTHDKDRTKHIVDEVDEKIAVLNIERYSLNYRETKIRASLADGQILFDPEEAKRLFGEAGVLFDGQIKRDFKQLISFNKSITEERRGYLQEELGEVNTELKRVNSELNACGKRRSKMLAFLSSTDVFTKYKQVSGEMVTLRSDIASLGQQRGHLDRLQELRTKIRTLKEERSHLQTQIESDVELQNTDSNSLFSSIRLYFSEIVEEVIARKALLSVSPNRLGNLEFKAEILDESGTATSADDGHTYRKLLCIAFDLAILRVHLKANYPRFVFHDGVFETLDNRKKVNLLAVIRQYADLRIQAIITLIDSDCPPQSEKDIDVFNEKEIILTLHDENQQGLLFKMNSW